MALDEAGMQQLVDQIYSLFTQQNEVNTFGSDPEGWADDHLPPGTEASDVSACIPEVADRLGGQYQGNLANYNAQAAPATASPITEIAYTYNTTYQQNTFIYAEEGSQVSVIQGDGNTVSQTQIDQDFEVGDDYYQEEPPDYGEPEYEPEPEPEYEPEPEDGWDPGDEGDEGDDGGFAPRDEGPEPEPEPEPEEDFEIIRRDTGTGEEGDPGLPGPDFV